MQTLHHRALLRSLTRKRFKHPTAAGAFWLPYAFIVLLLVAYGIVS